DEFLAIAYWRERRCPTLVARFFNTVGPRQTGRYGMVVPRFVGQALRGEPITVYGDGQQSRCLTHVSDAVRAAIGLMDSDRAVGVTASLLAALVLTPAARWLALRVGVVAHPMSERWHRRPTALFGGVAVGLATVVGVGVAALLGPSYGAEIESVLRGTAVGVALSGALMFLVGLLDDVVRLRAQLKFVLQLLAGVTLLSFGGLLDVS